MQIVGRLALVAGFVVAGLATTTAAAAANEMPKKWICVRSPSTARPATPSSCARGSFLAGPGDGADVARVLPDWKRNDTRAFGVTLFTRAPKTSDPAREIREALARVRKATSGRPQGPARVAPNHVFVGESVPTSAINFMGEPRIQGGPGSSVRPAKLPAAMPLRTTWSGDGSGVRIAVLDTGMFEHEWLTGVTPAPGSADVWDVEHDGYGDNESGHGTFIAGLIQQVAPSASIYAVKVLSIRTASATT